MKESYKFWYIVGTSLFACLYVILITFVPIDKEQQRFADTALGILLGTILAGGMNYLIGGSALPHTKEPTPITKEKMTAQAFWEIKDLNDTILAINGEPTNLTVAELPQVDTNYLIIKDDTDQDVLICLSSSTITLNLTGNLGDYIVTSSSFDYIGGRPPTRPK